ncbi:hypothetical protein C8A00DRAFT_42229 [Chaetomidium leptoderma]|uniref:Zn(2)-C6 fungal-type domain-containing protein n=1 Tax=Chaetomidium leptoderma TaxID=669021 RepID=A0AAN6ZZW0_9PEZI|nr:hypothetical protein C8A00DRAFT_42229 [Chaetomidium leptoderma]
MEPSPRRTPDVPRHPSLPRDESTNPTNTPPSDLKRILRERQLARNRKACLACRERKVRCNHQQPCQTCLKRGHADLCFYQEAGSLSNTTNAAENVPIPAQAHTSPTAVSDMPVNGTDVAGVPGTTPQLSHASETPTATPVLLGGNSIIAMARRDSVQPQADDERRTAFETGIFPLLGIDRDAQTGGQVQAAPPNSSLPDDQEMTELFNLYRHRVHPFHFILDDLDEVEKVVCSLTGLRQRPCDTHFLCLLHAILAAGAQFSDLAPLGRLSTSQKHLRHALSFLGTFDYLWNPSKKLLQALLILGHVLQNERNPRAAWILGGTTIRLALSLGIQQPGSTPGPCRISSAEAQHLRLAIVWQDALLSLAFDRPPASQEMDIESDIPALEPSGSSPADVSYRQAMNWLCHLTLRHLRSQKEAPLLSGTHELFKAFDALDASLSPHLNDRRRCSSIQDIHEHHSFELHRNFALSTLCRPILSRQVRQSLGEEESSRTLDRFQDALKRSVLAFVHLRSISNLATRSWAFIHNGLSSALLLAFMRHVGRDGEDTREIQALLVQSLTEKDEDNGQFSDAHKKALKALQTLQKLPGEGAAMDSTVDPPTEQRPPNGLYPLQENVFDFQDPMLDLDDWLRTVDFGTSPLEAYNFIRSNQGPLYSDL